MSMLKYQITYEKIFETKMWKILEHIPISYDLKCWLADQSMIGGAPDPTIAIKNALHMLADERKKLHQYLHKTCCFCEKKWIDLMHDDKNTIGELETDVNGDVVSFICYKCLVEK